MSATGALLGLVAGLGLALTWIRLPWLRRPGLDERLAPYLRDTSPPSRLLAGSFSGSRAGTRAGANAGTQVLERLLAPVLADAVRWVERISGGSASVGRRLDQLGGQRRLEQFRAEQVVWGVLGAAAGTGVGLLAAGGRGSATVPVIALTVIGLLLGVLGRDQWLSRQVRAREQRILLEFPTIAELVALSVSAGEGAAGALDRVARTCRGDLAAELRRVVGEARSGADLVPALEALAARTGVPSLARFVDGLAVALERGTPLADLLRAQAQDVRELSRRQLVESGGRREIAMTVPVVFLVLPVTVLFAVYPGLAVLDL